ncbi:hypothetical protein [Moorena sp. SIO4G3]|uniref:hypothetical protein n=1 Tax=Moorena sp. SIO4G3 TaxID=2607821 RepID=UPI0025CEDB89|nr:hypothetical protein [Moorena sp. SIO4G3]
MKLHSPFPYYQVSSIKYEVGSRESGVGSRESGVGTMALIGYSGTSIVSPNTVQPPTSNL